MSVTETTSGISFGLSDEQRALRELAREFAAKEIRPVAADYDERSQHPADVIAKAHEVGLMNPHIPEEHGGPGLSAFEQILIGEELAWGCSGIATSIVANILGSLPVLLAGSDEQKREWLPPLLEEPLLCSFALTEPGAGSDVSAIQTTAELRDGDYVVNGSKMFITTFPPDPTASSSRSTWTSWASGQPTHPRSPSRSCGCRLRTASARRAKGSRSRCGRST